MSLLGAIADYADTGTDEAVVALRTALESAKIWADVVPSEVEQPLIALSETGTRLVAERKTQDKKVVDVTVTFDVYDSSRASVENLLDLLEDAFATVQLSPTNSTHLKTTFGNRTQDWKEGLTWHGALDLIYQIEK